MVGPIETITAGDFRSNVSANWIRKRKTPLLIASGRKREPVAVLVPYAVFMAMQSLLEVIERGEHCDTTRE